MSDVYLVNLATRNAQWLSARQQVVSNNVANANTPGYRSADVKSFTEILDQTSLQFARTDPGHMNIAAGKLGAGGTAAETGLDTFHSGGNVSLENEMLKSAEIGTAYSLNTSIIKAFHRMALSVTAR